MNERRIKARRQFWRGEIDSKTYINTVCDPNDYMSEPQRHLAKMYEILDKEQAKDEKPDLLFARD